MTLKQEIEEWKRDSKAGRAGIQDVIKIFEKYVRVEGQNLEQ